MKCIFCKSKIFNSNRGFCNRKCYDDYIQKNGSLNDLFLKNNIRVCQNCKKQYKIKTNRTNKRFCSRKCFLNYKSKNGYKIKKCIFCNKKMTIYKKSKKQFCSKQCYHNYRENNMERYSKPNQQKESLNKSRNCVKLFLEILDKKSFSPDLKPRPDIIWIIDKKLIAIEIEKQKGGWKLSRRFDTYIKNKHNFDLVVVISRDVHKYELKCFNKINKKVKEKVINKIIEYHKKIEMIKNEK